MNEWIDVKERLPEPGTPCLVTDGEGQATAQRIELDDGGWTWGSSGFGGYQWGWKIGPITHWAHQQPPPGEGAQPGVLKEARATLVAAKYALESAANGTGMSFPETVGHIDRAVERIDKEL
jgi:hypothetical protein